MTLKKYHGETHWHDGRENPIESYEYYLAADVEARIEELERGNITLTKGGPSSDENVQLVCPTCNKRKGTR